MKIKLAAVFVLMATFCGMGSAEEPEITIRFVQTDHPSSFSPLLWVHVRNPSYSALELANKMASSALLVDGRSFPRTEPVFEGPPGLPVQGEWQGCMPLADYASPVTAGKHRVSLKLSDAQSNEETIRWADPVNWRKGDMKSRLKEVRDMAAALKKGVPRSCAEEWLTVKDGGVMESHRVRYYVEPQIKVVVPYSQAEALGRQDEAVSGRLKVYQENRVY